MSRAPKFLITGASGFVGRHLIEEVVRRHGAGAVVAMVPAPLPASEQTALARLRDLGIEILEVDLLRLPESRLKPPDFDVLIHLAGYAVTEDAHGPFAVNSDGTRHLLDWLGPALAGKRVIYAGTLASVDQRNCREPVRDDTPCRPLTPYGRTKLAGENWVRQRTVEHGGTFTILRLCTIVGPGFRPGGMFGVFPELLRRNAPATRLNWPGRVSFLNVADLVRVLLALPALPQTRNETFVTGNGEALTFDVVLDQIAARLGVTRKRFVLPAWFWRVAGTVAFGLAAFPLTPYRARIFCWRVAHLIRGGLHADANRLNSLLGGPFQSTQDSLREIYGAQP